MSTFIGTLVVDASHLVVIGLNCQSPVLCFFMYIWPFI